MGQSCQDDTRTELSRPGKPGLTTRTVEKNIQQHGCLEKVIDLGTKIINHSSLTMGTILTQRGVVPDAGILGFG